MSILDLFFAKKCFGCGVGGGYFCSRCRLLLSRAKPSCPRCRKNSIDGLVHVRCRRKYGLDRLISPFSYEGAVRKAVVTMKYRYSFDITRELSGLMIENLKDLNLHKEGALLVPIPMFRLRENQRGFNQSDLIGSKIARALGLNYGSDYFIKQKTTLSQTGLKKTKRLKNIRGSFKINSKHQNQPKTKTLIIFDDVFTTGATLREAAKVAKRAGWKRVWGITIAK